MTGRRKFWIVPKHAAGLSRRHPVHDMFAALEPATLMPCGAAFEAVSAVLGEEILMATEPPVKGRVTVRGAADGFVQEIVAGRHQLGSDEPISAGGTDTGPTPYDLLLAALGACTSMTVGMYARRKQWPLMQVTVQLSHSRVHATDCAVCDTENAMLTVIDREIEFDGPLSDEQRERLLAIANRCPVHLTLTSRIDIRTTLRASKQNSPHQSEARHP